MNKALGNKEFGVSGNHEKVSYGGKLVHQLLATKEYLLLNNTEKCKGGPFARYDPSDPTNELLTNRPPNPGYERDIRVKEIIHEKLWLLRLG